MGVGDSDASVYCPFCHKHTSLTLAHGTDYQGVREGYSKFHSLTGKWWMGVCNSCQETVLVNEQKDGAGNFKISRIYPQPLPKPVDERVPFFIKGDLEEAIMCFSVSAYRGTASLCRRILQLICLDKGAKKDRLLVQIEELGKGGIITKDMVDWTTSVRWVGNDASHPEKNDVERKDAEDVLNLVEQIIHVLYITPSISKAIKKKREIPEKKSDS